MYVRYRLYVCHEASLAEPDDRGERSSADRGRRDGGALSALVDTTAMAASWSAHELEADGALRGTTVGLSIDFVAAAQGQEVTADARVIRRGRSLCFCDVDVTDAGGRLVAKAIVTYKLG